MFLLRINSHKQHPHPAPKSQMQFSQYVNKSRVRAAVSCKSIMDSTQAFKGPQPEREKLGDETRKKEKNHTHHHRRQASHSGTRPWLWGIAPSFLCVRKHCLQPFAGDHFALELSPQACSLGFFPVSLIVSQLLITVRTCLKPSTSKGKRFTSVHKCRHFSPWPVVFPLIWGWQETHTHTHTEPELWINGRGLT